MADFYGFEMRQFTFDGHDAVLVLSDETNRTDKWLLRTEYFGAFPEAEIQALKEGYNLAHVNNTTRWCLPEDTERQAAFCRYLHTEYGLNEKCVPVGLSCGGMQAIFLTAEHPECVAAVYLDAPVVNFLSCPGNLGKGIIVAWDEFEAARGMTKMQLAAYRNHPLDRFDDLAAANVPILLVCGDSDMTVPYDENGEYLYNYAMAHGMDLTLWLKPGCDHHPHGMPDPADIVNWIKKYY